MSRLIADLETDGLLESDRPSPGGTKAKDAKIVSRIHCIVTQDVDSGHVTTYYDGAGIGIDLRCCGTLADGIDALNGAELIAGHNWLGYDTKVLAKLYPSQWKPKGLELDTQIGLKVCYPTSHLRIKDSIQARLGRFPKGLIGRHSLKAWGIRRGEHKGDIETDFQTFTKEMLEYCVQDVAVTRNLFLHLEERIKTQRFSMRAWKLEQAFARIMRGQEATGFGFDVEGAQKFTAQLQGERADLRTELDKLFPPFVDHYVTPKRQIAKSKVVQFNPGSRCHIARAFKEQHGWKPRKFTEDGRPQMDESILATLKYPGAPELRRYFLIEKILGMVAEGSTAWLKLVGPDGRIHGRVDHNGAVTSRCTHSRPNLTEVPRVTNPFGRESRRLFIARPGTVLLGVDASGLELRMLAHYLAPYDGGRYIQVVTQGDAHETNRLAAGIPAGPGARDTAKTTIYALLYGAGDRKLAATVGCSLQEAKRIRRGLLKNLSIGALLEDIGRAVAIRGTVKLPDGRVAWIRSPHSALNTLLQGGGAVLMKEAVRLMEARFLEWGVSYRQTHQAHDEIQLEVEPQHAETAKKIAIDAIVRAGESLRLRCPMKGEAKIGSNWSETH